MKLTKRNQKKLFNLIVGLALILGGYLLNNLRPPEQLGPVQTPGYFKVASFEDGDTITVDMNGKNERVRMIGVDTPETQDPRKPVQCFGQAASEFTKQLIGNQSVRLEADPLNSNRDRYNRLLRHVYLPDGRLVQAEIIKNGYGFAYTSFPFTKSEEFRNLQKQAREQNRGLWSECSPSKNDFGGYTSNPE